MRDELQEYRDRLESRFLSRAEEAELARRMHDGDIDARNRLVESVLPLVVHMARKYRRRGVPLMELVSIANHYLVRHVVPRLDPCRGRLTTLVVLALRHRMSIWCEQWRKWRLICEGHDHFYEPRKVSTADGLPINGKLQGINVCLHRMDHDDPHCLAVRAEDIEGLHDKLRFLTDRPREVVLRRAAGETLREIGESMGVTRERVRQFWLRGMRKLRALYGVDDSVPWIEGSELEALFSINRSGAVA